MKYVNKTFSLCLVFLAVLLLAFFSAVLQGIGNTGNTGRNDDDDSVRFTRDDSMNVIQFKLQQMRKNIARQGDQFEVGVNPAMEYSLAELCTPAPEYGADLSGCYSTNLPATDISITPICILPASYTGYYTSVKNQGSCSAWALVTCGVFEGAIKKVDGITVDLSEEWLIECNPYGYTCTSGWFAHGMHVAPGAVLGSEFIPGDCTHPYSHPYILDSWAYVGTSTGVPSTTAIKCAILRYGSVAALVYVDSYFQAYTGGCYTRNVTAKPNHFIILVGWDDSRCTTGGWRLKNSWGTGWGESGFMWIKYGVSQVGYAANYVVY